ncbi:DsbA family oxidoreductase [Paenibacillus lentus]|uniref:DsbA family oxidoreductase n=1 Tax=Paenibacillus lentus TaxID=1338368 RepID=A0A3Q8S9E5_9BACL|nr:DsbA family oxidoreductase [Paenibacillus lentus]AZK45426.1 DsbA family oxidoreductase [Paenibacillus lentus]
MKIDIWSDFACPFCYIGKRKFEAALEKFPHRDQVEVGFRSFELAPDAQKNTGKDMNTVLAEKYGMPYERAKQMNDQVTLQAAEVGLEYHMDSVIPTNTHDAHQLTHFAKQHGKANEMAERLFKAYFTEGLDLGDLPTLARLAAEIGLNEHDALKTLEEAPLNHTVTEELQEGARLGITGVPFFVFNNKYAVSGAQPSETFLEVLQQVWQEEQQQPLQVITGEAGGNSGAGSNSDPSCSDDSCSV